ncbi:MAG: urate oxidase [Phycisphaerales bacterium]|nr:urate oxidase [Phycisphaerales bacterium]
MPEKITLNTYGKSNVRLTKVTRHVDRHDLTELSVDITLTGNFERSYTHGDNSNVVATDSMKNTVYVLAKTHPLDSPESFAHHLAEHFVKTYAQVKGAEVSIEQSAWRRIDVAGRPHPTAFESAGAELRTTMAYFGQRDARPAAHFIQGGLAKLLVLKTTDSAFTGFVRDAYTTLPETRDRILATEVSATWTYNDDDRKPDYNAAFTTIRTALLETFARHKSDAVQQTLYDMGIAALAAETSISGIHLLMPNKHRVPFNLRPFGMEFENDIFVTTSEPSGEISALIEREK